jgi:nucleotide-binding universal stress UspA family protein
MFALKNVLVATDFGEPAASALAYGRDLARQYDATLHVLHVADNVVARYAGDVAPLFTGDMQREIEQASQTQLDALLTDEDRAQLRARSRVESSLSPAETIVGYARANAIDLIVVGTHGRGAVKHLLLGSVAERVVRLAPCPVLTIHSPEREFLAPDALAAVSVSGTRRS